MSSLINTYPVFENSQVLTSSQLNQMISYLDQQSRLTRVRLIGTGIVCGLGLSYEEPGGAKEIAISKGTAVTSEGFLIAQSNCTTKYYRPYELPEGVVYNPFGDPEQDVTLYELLSSMPEDTTGVQQLNTPGDFLDDKFVLLFIEIFDNDLKSCLANSCDELGIERIFNIRKLLISKDDLDTVLTRSSNVNDLYPNRLTLPDVDVPKVLFDANAAHSSDEISFYQNYATTILNSVFDELLASGGALSQTYDVYSALLEQEYDYANPFEEAPIQPIVKTWRDYLNGTSAPGEDYVGIQYFYDFIKDLVMAYDEFRESAFDLMSECCTDMSRFPKHVMLGRALVDNQTDTEKTTYRHGFTQPPVYNLQEYLGEKVISLHKRLVAMLEGFNLERINNAGGEESLDIRITPSMEKVRILSHRSIPFYYDMETDSSLAGGSLSDFWNFDTTRKKAAGTSPLNHGYFSQSDDQNSAISKLETPLFYDHENYPFLRIEGLLGKSYQDAMESIESIKHDFDLPFDLLSLQLNDDAEFVELDYSCGFEDLQEDYTLSRSNICGMTGDLGTLLEFISKNRDQIFGENDEDVEGDLNAIAEIVESWKVMCASMPECLHDINFEQFQEAYKAFLERTLHFILIRKELLDEIEINPKDSSEETPVINGLIQRVAPILFRFVDMLWYNSVLKIYYGFKRREFYLQKQIAVFSSYIKKHPGVEHQAGVQKGGTFIIVYDDEENSEVIADFSLPYLCCSTNNCVPMCDDEDGFDFNIPPIARPDYGITTIDQPIEIFVTLNDSGFFNSDFEVNVGDESEQGGKVEPLEENGRLKYTPPEEFTGLDFFEYEITDRHSGISDTGTVYVLVKSEDVVEPAGCYSVEILNCWGITPAATRNFLKFRGLEAGNIPEADLLNTMSTELRRTGGFTENEIQQGPLSNEVIRQNLVNCLELDPNGSAEYREQAQLILDYQAENCGDSDVVVNTCYSRNIISNWGGGKIELLTAIHNQRNPNNKITFDTYDAAVNALLDSLRSTNGFTLNEVRQSIFSDRTRLTLLLNELGVQFPQNGDIKDLQNLLIQYQQQNCGQQNRGRNRVTLTPGELSVKEVTSVLTARGVETSENINEAQLKAMLAETTFGYSISSDELSGFTKNRLGEIMDARGINYRSSDTKSKFIETLRNSGR